MKTAEFTDHASAAAFIAAGRKKGERATADGWNTMLYADGGDFVLKLHGAEIVRYAMSRTEINIPMRNHVVADRVQRYGFADKFQLNTVGGKWSLSQAWGTMAGIDEDPTIWYPVVSEVPSTITIDGSGTLISPVGNPMPAVLKQSDRDTIWEKPIKAWLAAAMKQLDAGWDFVTSDWRQCPLCLPFEGVPGTASVAYYAISNGHILSHVLEGKVLPSTVVGLVATIGFGGVRPLNVNIDPAGNGHIGGGTSGGTYNHDAARRTLKTALRSALR